MSIFVPMGTFKIVEMILGSDKTIKTGTKPNLKFIIQDKNYKLEAIQVEGENPIHFKCGTENCRFSWCNWMKEMKNKALMWRFVLLAIPLWNFFSLV